MKKLSLIASGFLLLACLTSVSHATTVTLAEFTKANANNTCSTTQDLTIKFKPHESMGEYQVTIPVKLKPLASDRFKRTANIVVRKIGASPQVLKIIADTPNSVENDPCFVRIEDFNFDGYLDIANVDSFGAKWGGYQFWLFDKASQTYVTSPISKKLGELAANEITFDAKHQIIQSHYLSASGGIIREAFQIKKNKLILVEDESEKVDPDKQTVTRIIRKRIKGKMKPITTRTEKL